MGCGDSLLSERKICVVDETVRRHTLMVTSTGTTVVTTMLWVCGVEQKKFGFV